MYKLEKSLHFLCVILLALMLGAWTFKDQIGNAKIQIDRSGITQEIRLGDELKKYDKIYVGLGTKILLTEGESKIWVGENTVLRVDQIKATNSDAIQLDSGKIRVQIKATEAAKWKFNTQSSVSGVRGTEFFISSSEASESICVLEGSVESELTKDPGKKFLVPAGKGVQIREGEAAVMIDNSNFLVNQWLAETLLEDELGYIPATYATNTRIHTLNESLTSSVSGNFFYCDFFNTDFDQSTIESSRDCFRAHLYPSLQISSALSARLTPRLSFVSSNQDLVFDSIPPTSGYSHSALTVSEAYLNTIWQKKDWRVGFQKLKLADGLLVSEAQFLNEPLTHLGLRATDVSENQNMSFFVSRGLEGQNALDGFFPHSLSMLDLKIFESRGEVYLLRVDSVDPKDKIRAEIHETNLGFLFSDRTSQLDYKFSGIFQHGDYTATPTASPVSVSHSLADLQIGFYATNLLRLFARYLDAGANFVSVAPAAYSLGLFPGFYQIGNIRQARTGAEYRLSENRHLTFEYLASWDQDKDGILKWRAVGSDNSFISEELNLLFKHKWDDYISYQAGGFWFLPHSHSMGSDPAYGLQAWLIVSL